jgi:hypothetical protein
MPGLFLFDEDTPPGHRVQISSFLQQADARLPVQVSASVAAAMDTLSF